MQLYTVFYIIPIKIDLWMMGDAIPNDPEIASKGEKQIVLFFVHTQNSIKGLSKNSIKGFYMKMQCIVRSTLLAITIEMQSITIMPTLQSAIMEA